MSDGWRIEVLLEHPEELKLVKNYRALDAHLREALLAASESLVAHHRRPGVVPERYRSLPAGPG